ncbi:hypothetical protein HPP92_018534 [Vanilla planifolia]|uniref:Uncharacterized protein n=1 Tax=Vanilla planifolia TaxID=51239 RepID=A0A835QA11_VANPL|nr:hypothetical protein HPP92_018534 [Vanilla planifolia]
MELALSLGEPPARPFAKSGGGGRPRTGLKLGFRSGLVVGQERREESMEEDRGKQGSLEGKEIEAMRGNPIVQLNLLPLAPVQSQESLPIGFPWTAVNGNLEASTKLLDVNQTPFGEDAEEGAAISLSPNSSISSFPMELAGGMDFATAAVEAERASSKGSDDEDNGGARKKLRLSKEQSAFLEESFKEQNTLNPVRNRARQPSFREALNDGSWRFLNVNLCFFILEAEVGSCQAAQSPPSSSRSLVPKSPCQDKAEANRSRLRVPETLLRYLEGRESSSSKGAHGAARLENSTALLHAASCHNAFHVPFLRARRPQSHLCRCHRQRRHLSLP